MDQIALGVRIREARKRKGLSADDLAERCKVGSVHIRKIEAGIKVPSIKTFVHLCNALQTSPEYLLQDSLVENDLSSQLKILDKISLLPKNQSDMVYGIINTVIEHEN